MYEVHKQSRNILGFHVLLGREGGRERLGQVLLQFGSKKLLFSFQFPTWQKIKKCDVLPKEEQKPSPPNKREKGNVMFCQRKNKKTMTTQHKGKGKLASACHGSY
jgi:hypothetical protein